MEKAKVSLIIPIYNVSLYLTDTLNSAIGQTLKDIEIICVDDASDDGSDQILRDFCAADPRIKAIYHETCLSASQARKDAAAASCGEYIMFLDGDDELVPEACEKAVRAIEQAKTDIVQFGTLVVNCAGMSPERILSNQRALNPRPEQIVEEDLLAATFLQKRINYNLWNKIYRGDIVRKAFAGLENGAFPKANDLYAFFMIAKYSSSFCTINDVLYHYCFGRGSTGGDIISLQKFEVILTEKRVCDALENFCEQQNDPERFAEILLKIRERFLGECLDRCLNNLTPSSVGEGFDRLIDTWGYEDILCAAAKRYWNDQSAVLSKFTEIKDYFRSDGLFSGRKLTVAFYYWHIQGGGAQRVTVELANLFSRAKRQDGQPKYKVVLITDMPKKKAEYPAEEAVIREVLPNKKSAEKDFHLRYEAWRRIIDQHSIDIIVDGDWTDAVTPWDMLCVKGGAGRHPAFVLLNHNFTMVPYQFNGNNALSLMYLYQFSDGITVLSETDRIFVSHFCPNVRYIPNPVDYLEPKTGSESEKNAKSIVWTGRFSSEKQPMDMVRMMKYVSSRVPDARLYLVGNGRERVEKQLREETQRLGLRDHIIFTGFTRNVSSYLHMADIYVCTSQYEGFPLSIAEALSCSIPVVMYDLPWLTVVKDGRGITTVPMGRYDKLAEEVVYLLENPEYAQARGKEGREQIDDLAKVDIEEEWSRLFDGIGREEMPAFVNRDEHILFTYMTLYQGISRGVSQQQKKDLREARKQIRFLTSVRVDLKNSGTKGSDLLFDDPSFSDVNLRPAPWLTDEAGHGYLANITAQAGGNIGSFRGTCICKDSGTLQIALRGMNVEGDDGKRIPYWMDILEFTVDGKEILTHPINVCFGKPYLYEIPVTDGQPVEIGLTFKPHGSGKRIDAENKAKIEALTKKKETLIGEKHRLEEELSRVKNSFSYRLGRKLTAPIRKIRRMLKRSAG